MNQDLKDRIRKADIYQWRVAQQCGVSESTLVRWLRYELTPDRREAILKAINDLTGKGE